MTLKKTRTKEEWEEEADKSFTAFTCLLVAGGVSAVLGIGFYFGPGVALSLLGALLLVAAYRLLQVYKVEKRKALQDTLKEEEE